MRLWGHLRAVIDTNVLVSAQSWHGAPHNLLVHVRDGDLILILSPALLAEFAEVIGRARFQTILQRTGRSQSRTRRNDRPAALAMPVCRDPDDDKILALARAAQADVIISGDKDLLTSADVLANIAA